MPSIARILELAPVAQYLASNAVSKNSLFKGGSVDPKLPITIFMVNKILARIYSEDPAYPNIRPVADYLYELIHKYAYTAAAIYDGNSGGSIVPPTPPSTSLPNPLDWKVSGVASPTAPLATGESSVTLDGTGGFPDFRGYNVDYFRGGIPQYTTNMLDGSTYYLWDRNSGLFQIFGAAQLDEQMRISPIG